MEYNTLLRINWLDYTTTPSQSKSSHSYGLPYQKTKRKVVIKTLKFHKMVSPLQYGPIQQHAPCVLDTNHRLMILQGTGSTK